MAATKNTELRKLRPAEFYNFALILSPSDSWKKLVSVVTKDENGNVPKFDGESITILEQASRNERKPAAAIFLEEWSTMGRKRPTLGLLLDYLMKAELFRAADYLAEEILKIEAPKRPSYGPAVAVDAEEALAEILGRQNLNEKAMDSDFSQRLPINLSRVDYPMHLLDTAKSQSDNNYAVGDNEVGIFEMRCNQSRSHQVLDPARPFDRSAREKEKMFERAKDPGVNLELKDNGKVLGDQKAWNSSGESRISDLIKFSKDSERFDEKIPGISHSDLIKFSSANIGTDESIKNETCEAMLPNFDALRGDSSGDHDEERISEEFHENKDFIREMASSELPAILKDFERPDYFHRELTTSELPVCINNRSGFDTIESSFSSSESTDDSSRISTDRFSASVDTTSNENQSEKNICEPIVQEKAFDSRELPITVLEFQKR